MNNFCVQVAVYDDRVEVTSPGMLYGGLTLEEALSGRSKIRNRAIAEVFSRMDIIEEWGTGIRRIIKRAQEYGLPEAESTTKRLLKEMVKEGILTENGERKSGEYLISP